MYAHITFAARPDCYNMMAKCFGNCYGCGCCTKKKPDRWENRIRYLTEELEGQERFDSWDDDPELRALQERNVKENIKYINRRINIYQGLLDKYREEEQNAETD